MTEKTAKTLEALRGNRMNAVYAENKEEAKKIALSLIPCGSSIAVGGSVTLKELDLLTEFRSGKYEFIDRYAAKDREETEEMFRRAFSADFLVCSSNAITEKGELYNVDGTANRVAALTYGPKKVIIIAGENKIVPDLAAAVERVKTVAAPLNCRRLEKKTYCAEKGRCVSMDNGTGCDMTSGCKSPDRICRDYVIMAEQAVKDRVTVIIVGESLGY